MELEYIVMLITIIVEIILGFVANNNNCRNNFRICCKKVS